jgi:hypothetical protein
MTIGVIHLFISFLQVGFVIQCYDNYHIPKVEVINNAKDSLTGHGISLTSQLQNSTIPTCLVGLNPTKVV